MAREGITLEVISETKNKATGEAYKRMVVEKWQETKHKKASRTYHEKLSRMGNWTRGRKVDTSKKKKKGKKKHASNKN